MSVWEECVLDARYEIMFDNEHNDVIVRRKSNGRILRETYNLDGYLQICIGGRTFGKHYVIASQWIENDDPEHKTEVHHRNDQRDDNSIDNLEWITHSDNIEHRAPFRKQQSEFMAELPEYAINISEYKNIEYPLNKYWFDIDNQRIISRNDCRNPERQYKVIRPSKEGSSALIVLRDVEGHQHTLGYNKLIRALNQVMNNE